MSSQLIRQDLVPIGVGYLLLMGVLAVGLRLQRRSSAKGADGTTKPPASADEARVIPDSIPTTRSWLVFGRRVGGTALGGYVLLMAIVVIYYYGVARVGSQFLQSAFTGCALLLALCLPLYAAASWLTVRRRRKR